MRYLHKLLIRVSFLLLNIITAQEVHLDSTWTKTFGGSEHDEGHCVQQTTDGGYIIAAGNQLIKTNQNGDSTWTKTLALWSLSVQQTTDGGYIITGNFNAAPWLIKTDFQGTEEWNQIGDFIGTKY